MKGKLLLLLLLAGMTVRAQDENLKMRFDFENVSGTSVTDNISGVTAKTVGAAKVVEMGSRHVLDLGNGSGYLNMTVNAGKIVRQLEDFTISVYYCVARDASLSGAGYFLWAFSQLSANTEISGPYMGYRINAQRSSRPFDLRIFQSPKYNRAPGCCIDSITFTDFIIHPEVPDSCILPSRVEGAWQITP